jgi:hypothetical protein
MALAGKDDVLDTVEGRKAVQAMATYLGIDPLNEKQLVWIAERALMAPLPRNWEEISTPDGKVRRAHGLSPLDVVFCTIVLVFHQAMLCITIIMPSHVALASDVLHAQCVQNHVVAAPPRRLF